MSNDTIELDGIALDALASVTRRNILKKIKCKPMTVSELERDLSINKSAIFKHLLVLQEADLIVRRTNDNMFVYYELTTKGKDITEPQGTIKKIIFLLATSGFVFILGLFVIFKSVETTILPKYWVTPPVNSPILIVGSVLVIFAALFLILELRMWGK